MKKYVIENKASRSFFTKFENERPVFDSDATRAKQFVVRSGAEAVLTEDILPLMTQKTKHNECWNSGFLLSITEVYV